MIHGHLSTPDAYAHLLGNDAWRFAFDWLKALPPNPEPGIRELRGEDIYVNVHGYDTLPPERCRYESHRRYVDLQYCIGGGELIDWQLASTLKPAGPFDVSKDLQFYEPGDSLTRLQMLPGSFAIFFPSDAHRPKRADGFRPSVSKLVIKVAHRLVS
ncbi:MAG: YhcH/YjgK/YiaL family protein [Verrucomicrobiales bacterium]|nr:YhcH/YjgK/YiaL family protein [Verrucomicrobiales bacterium]